MNNEIKVFENNEFGNVRVVTVDNEPWFVGKDVAEILEYKDTADALKRHVDSDEKLTREFTDSGQRRKMYIINESGLYSLILSSHLPSAKRFKRWITSEVLPSIRKYGAYATEVTIDRIIDDPDFGIELLQKLKTEREKNKNLETTVAAQNQQIAEMQPKVSYYDIVLQCKDVLPISVIAKDYGWSAKKLNKFLNEMGVQYKQSGKTWLLYQNYANEGLTSTKTHVYTDSNAGMHSSVHTYWTQKGRLFIYDLLKRHDVLPLVERA